MHASSLCLSVRVRVCVDHFRVHGHILCRSGRIRIHHHRWQTRQLATASDSSNEWKRFHFVLININITLYASASTSTPTPAALNTQWKRRRKLRVWEVERNTHTKPNIPTTTKKWKKNGKWFFFPTIHFFGVVVAVFLCAAKYSLLCKS